MIYLIYFQVAYLAVYSPGVRVNSALQASRTTSRDMLAKVLKSKLHTQNGNVLRMSWTFQNILEFHFRIECSRIRIFDDGFCFFFNIVDFDILIALGINFSFSVPSFFRNFDCCMNWLIIICIEISKFTSLF